MKNKTITTSTTLLFIGFLLLLPGAVVVAVTLANNVYFTSLNIAGAISKGSGTFVIDHPLDPENKLLYHSFVESPDVKNLYDGIATLNSAGEATVVLPDYFEVLNTLPVVLLTPLGQPAPDVYVAEPRTEDNTFRIVGGPPNARISWQVTGIRQDPYILANPIIPEVEKGPDALVDKGEYLFEDYPR